MFALTRGMLNGEDNDFLGRFIEDVIDKIRILARHELADTHDLLTPSDRGKQGEVFRESKIEARTRSAAAGLFSRT